MFTCFRRGLYTGPRVLASSKSPLAKLRKKTGYSLSICKKALEKHDQDIAKAEIWLKEQAQAEGWAKATKLSSRNTTQGLIGLLIKDRAASMIELNCETDFVARNNTFHELLNQITAAVLADTTSSTAMDSVSLRHFSSDDLVKLKRGDKTLGDLIALNIGQIGENIVLRRGVTYQVPENISLTGVSHPSAAIDKTMLYGRYGSLLAYVKDENVGVIPKDQTTATMARQLCQHIIGMNPEQIGTYNPEDEKDDEPKKEGEESDEEGEIPEKVESKDLVNQNFLLDDEIKVGQLLQETGITVEGFVRFEVGQDLSGP